MRYLPNFRSSSFDVRPPIYDCDFTRLRTLTDLENKGFSYARSGPATYINDNGIVVYNQHNYISASQTFNVTWTLDRFTVTYPVFGEIAPDGTSTVNRINEDAAANTGRSISRGISSSTFRDLILTFSVYLKEDVNSNPRRYTGILSIGSTEAVSAAFDIRNGFGSVLTTSQSANAKYVNSGVIDVGNGWYRCWVQIQVPYTASGGSTSFRITSVNTGAGVAPTLTNGNIASYTGGGASAGIFCWGAQVEINAGPREYIPTTTSAVYWPRFLPSKGLLMEAAAANQLTWSETFGTTGSATNNWIYSGITTSVGSTSPNNITTAIRFKHDGSTTGSATIGISNAVGSVGRRSFSVWAKQIGTLGTAWYSYNFGITQSPFVGITNEWQRYEFASTNQNQRIMLGICGANEEFEFWGAQLENAEWPSSYVPTSSVTITRVADAIGIVPPQSAFINSESGSLMADYAVNSAAAAGAVVINALRLGKGNCVAYYALGEFSLFPTSNTTHRTITNFAGTIGQSSLIGTTWQSGEFRTAAFSYIRGACLLGFIEGLSGAAPTPNAALTAMNKIDFGTNRSQTVQSGRQSLDAGSMWFKRLKYWNTYLDRTDLAKITGAS